ncbi:hypothetical protein F2Q70_00020982 [Brassica cretica]|uniref:mitogen-activated protein kinase kinase n=2 Tax=Brassica cretica TaxID=69181 RepID=A0A3N6REY4_BRACR|nr:hypothetical protein F2Q70_00020982 [Brassica cretica]KAF2557848.1 hypothetical protein F2Q68_00014456 [Brassica cretica]KAF3605862.1 hypothetical protein DY000_02046951 [Brassica cretica]
MSLVRERCHQEPLTLPIPPPPHYHGIPGDPSPSSFSSSSPDSSSPVQTLNDLEKLTVLGEGSDGTVYKTRHRRTTALYALKLIRSDLSITTVEADTLKRIESSLIELLLAQHVLPDPVISTLANRILQGLRHLQEMRIVHGDIKPSNLLINKKGEVKIADFGASRIVTRGDYGSSGTCAYMSPERVDPDKWGFEEVVFARDVWSLGAVVLECYLGRHPLTKVGDQPDWTALVCAICCNEKAEIQVSGSFDVWRRTGGREPLWMSFFIILL